MNSEQVLSRSIVLLNPLSEVREMHQLNTYAIAVIVFCMACLFSRASVAQFNDEITTDRLHEIESFIGVSDTEIARLFGDPDEAGLEADVWTYIDWNQREEVKGYQLFGMWGGKVGCFGMRRLSNTGSPNAMYASVLEFMGENGRSVIQASMSKRVFNFTENFRLSRRLDNLWEVDMSGDKQPRHVTLFVTDTASRGCRRELVLEALRIEKKHGISFNGNGDTGNE